MSRVDVNVRVRRKDGKPLSLREAKRVMRAVAHGETIPNGYEVSAICWRNPRRHSTFTCKGAQERHGPLAAVIEAIGDWTPSRVGAVKEP